MWKKQSNDGGWIDFSSDVNDRVEKSFQNANHIIIINGNTLLFTEMLFIESNGSESKMVRSHIATPELPWGFEAMHGDFCPCDNHMSALLTIARRNKFEEIVVHDYHGGSSKRVYMTSIPIVQKNEETGMTRVLNAAPVQLYNKAKRPFPDYADAPDCFKCPLTYELMHDPVIAADGHTYERAAIEEQFTRCKVKSPMINKTLKTPVVYANLDKRNNIHEWLDATHPEWNSKQSSTPKKLNKKKKCA
tara:strand:+ start:4345 stop:5085 length:741 start_codon:yes stop_codon:yes gene_type:complete